MKYLDGLADGSFTLTSSESGLSLDPVLAQAAQEGFVFSADDLRKAFIQRQRLIKFVHGKGKTPPT